MNDPLGPAPFSVVTTRHDDHVHIELTGELDSTTEAEVAAGFATLGGDAPQQFVVDARGLTFVGSPGISIVERLLADHAGSTVTIIGASPTYIEMLSIAGFGPQVRLVHQPQRSPCPRPAADAG